MRSQRKRWFGLAVVLVAGARSVHAEETGDDDDGSEAKAQLATKIDDLIEVAVRLNPDLTKARLDRSAARDSAEAARRPHAWVFTAGVQYQRSAYSDKVDLPLFSPVAQEQIVGSLGLGTALSTGGSVQVEFDVQHQNQELNVPTGMSSANAMTGGTGMGAGQCSLTAQGNIDFTSCENVSNASGALKLTLTQPLLRGFGPTVALAPERKADLAAASATIDAQIAAEKMIKELITQYRELQNSEYTVRVRQLGLELAKTQESLTRDEVRSGVAPQSALNSIKYEIASREEALLTAKQDYESKSLDLRKKAGLEISRRQIVLQPGEPFELPPEEDVDVEAVIARSHATNRQLAQIAIQKKAAELEVSLADDQMKPQLDMSVQGAIIGMGTAPGDAIGSFGQSYQISASLKMSFEITGATRKARDAARTKRHRLDIDRAAAEREIDVAIVAAARQVVAARKRVELGTQAIALAEENVRTERASFAAGTKGTTNLQVMQRTSQLIDAKLRLGRATTDYFNAVTDLQYLAGTLLERYGVEVKPRAVRR